LTPIVVTIQAPIGLFFPVAVLGASFGRIFGEIVLLIFPNGIQQCHHLMTDSFCEMIPISPQWYSVIGAAATIGANTQSISATLLLMGMVSYKYMLPTMYTSAISILVHRVLYLGSYEALASVNKLRYIGNLNWINHAVDSEIRSIVTKFETPYPIDGSGVEAMLKEVEKLTLKDIKTPLVTPTPLHILLHPTITVQQVVDFCTIEGCNYFYVYEGEKMIGIIEKLVVQKIVSDHHKMKSKN